MSYIVPSVLVYQELENTGGIANVVPDLETCVIGPAYNVLRYVPGSNASLVQTAATSSSVATGSMVAGSAVITFAVIPPFVVGDTLIIPGAGDANGSALAGKVLTATGVNLTLDSVAILQVDNVLVSKQGILTNAGATNTYNLPNKAVGQVIDASSVQVFANQAKIETLATGFTGYAGNNVLTYSAASGACAATAASTIVTGVTNTNLFREGDTVSVSGAGSAGGSLTAKIITIAGNAFTLNVAASTTNGSATITKVSISNVNSVTSTLMVEAGDEVSIEYTDVNSVAQVFSTIAVKVNSATGILSTVNTADVLPAIASPTVLTTAAVAGAATGFTLASATGFSTGDTVIIKGAGVGGADHEAVIGTLTGAIVTALSPPTVTATSAQTTVIKRTRVTFKTRKLFNNQLVPLTKPLTGGANYSTANVSINGTLAINPNPEIIYGKLISGTIHIPYKALRTDLSSSVMSIEQGETAAVFGDVSEDNPLALGVSIALANTTTRVRAIAVSTNDSAGYSSALELAQGERLYTLVPLTQDVAICQAFAAHVKGMSTPVNASWRMALVNTVIPTKIAVGTYTDVIVNANSGNNSIVVSAGKYVLTSSNSTFMSDGVVPGDTLNVTAGTGAPSPVGSMQVLEVVSNQQIVVQALGVATGVSFYVTRTLSKTQRAAAVAAASNTFGSNRVVHVQPDVAVVNVSGRKVVAPGYYLACAVAGLIAGLPSQQGLTNIGIAGVSDISNSNFTFTRAQLNTMAAAGTLMLVQETSGSLPYIRHELTTDMSTLEYREIQQVKNWDFLSYYFYDQLKSFTGKWNITPDSISVVRQTITAGSESLKAKKLPRIGAPLLSMSIERLGASTTSKDNLEARLKITMPGPLNYLNLYLVI